MSMTASMMSGTNTAGLQRNLSVKSTNIQTSKFIGIANPYTSLYLESMHKQQPMRMSGGLASLLMSDNTGDLFDKAFEKVANKENDSLIEGQLSAVVRGSLQPRQQLLSDENSFVSNNDAVENSLNSINGFRNNPAKNHSNVGIGGYQNDKIVQVLLEDSKYFKIGEIEYEYYDLDPIFFLQKPTHRLEHLID